ncbi:hypothetical protein MKW94_006396 [Papaver nudicaule]|uniref:TFIIS N-terminal domain-containing protein n=1 Tax=Papaver nudicaule TaxID=74823 RepID=A0AA41S9B8_PAPNU|nr:hypothetical protein [Papaver nudicaule]
MFLSRTDEETAGNKKLAKDLVDKWSRPIFNKSTRFEDTRKYLEDDDRALYKRQPTKKIANKAVTLNSRDIDLDEFIPEKRYGDSSSGQYVSRPEAAPLDFVVRPESKIDPEEIRARAKLNVQDKKSHRVKIEKQLKKSKAPKKKVLQASRLSAEGRNMFSVFSLFLLELNF